MNTACSYASRDVSRARQDHAQGGTLKRRTRPAPAAGRVRRPDHWIYLDRWWATRLGVTRTAGLYRIRSRDLIRVSTESPTSAGKRCARSGYPITCPTLLDEALGATPRVTRD